MKDKRMRRIKQTCQEQESRQTLARQIQEAVKIRYTGEKKKKEVKSPKAKGKDKEVNLS